MPEYAALLIIVLGVLCVVLLSAVFVMLAIIMGLSSSYHPNHVRYYQPASASDGNLWKARGPR